MTIVRSSPGPLRELVAPQERRAHWTSESMRGKDPFSTKEWVPDRTFHMF